MRRIPQILTLLVMVSLNTSLLAWQDESDEVTEAVDTIKRMVEFDLVELLDENGQPLELVVEDQTPLPRDDQSKMRVEAPLERLVASGRMEASVNPEVEPGKVHWYDDFETACIASRDSGRPVLLFHLLGELDQRFT